MDLTRWEQKDCMNTLVCFLIGMKGKAVIVELKNESFIQGKLIDSDLQMNLYLSNVTISRNRNKFEITKCDEFFISGSNIRMVHFNNNIDEIYAINRSFKLMGKGKGKRFETQSLAYQNSAFRRQPM
ncbi:unnamed protein product [Dracunculus medinensis]|uniref:Sm domain-containing protein n=1 Tax=Dracunculus medinensis TaxID=318479 RepID=A0A0N4UFI7_DRAME|nr:unnamed protein product [Dracunculus medinensis]